MVKTAILAIENCMNSSVNGPLDILSVACLEWTHLHPDATSGLFQLDIITDDGLPITCFSGTTIRPHRSMRDCTHLDLVIIPVIYGDLDPILSNRGLVQWLRDQSHGGVVICAVCAGVFLAAETGLLNGRKATTHWHLARKFQRRFPEIALKKEKMIVDEGDFITAGGVTAYMDLSLYIVRRFGSPELAASLSKILLIDPARRSQTPYSAAEFHITHGDENVLKAQHWMARHMGSPFSVSRLADIAGLGERTFARRFKRATGDTPLEYLQHLRITQARTLLETTRDPVDAITYATGYEDVSSFRRLFKKITGLSPTAYRKRFSMFKGIS